MSSGESGYSREAVRVVKLQGPPEHVRQPMPVDVSPGVDIIAAQLEAARPLTWRGKGDLLQVPWIQHRCPGTWLVIDLWSGVGGLLLAVLSLGLHCYALSAESDPMARRCAAANFPHVVHVDDVAQVHGAMFRPFLAKRKPRGILLGGGSPCQGNTRLNRQRKGLGDLRSHQPYHIQRIRGELQALPECDGVEIVGLLENVASMPPEVRLQYDEWLGGGPVKVSAGQCGWVQRNRLYWLVSSLGDVATSPCQVEGWSVTPCPGDIPELHYTGSKPIPAIVNTVQGFKPMFDPQEVVASQGRGAMYPFTRAFFHPDDLVSQCTPEAAARFYQDHRRFPAPAYEERSLLWNGSSWRTPLPSERLQVMGWPAGAVDHVEGPADQRRQHQNSFIGNGFHIPTLLAILCFLPGLLATKVPTPIFDVEEHSLKERLAGTVWEPARLDTFPGLLDPDQLVVEMATQLSKFQVPPVLWNHLRQRLQACDIRQLQAYTAWCRMNGLEWQVLGPQPIQGRDRAKLFAGLTGQRYAGDTNQGLDHLLPPGLGPEAHVAAARLLPSPFQAKPWPEQDVTFVLKCICVWRQHLPGYANVMRRRLRAVATALGPLELHLDSWRCRSSKKVAASKRPGFVAALSALLRWPDTHLAAHLVEGFPIIGAIEASGLFRPVAPQPTVDMADWLGDAAEQAVAVLVQSRPPRFSEDILTTTLQEVDKGFCSPLRPQAWFDRHYGAGNWRPMERFIIQQQDGKKRVIDNCRKTHHNGVTQMEETIHCVSVDFVAATIRSIAQELQVWDPADWACFPWIQPRLGTEDLPDAYRGLPVTDEHLPYSVVGIFDPAKGWCFTQLWGLAYGLESAVVSFNRVPMLGIAATRRCLGALSASYFDDLLAVEVCATSDASRRGLLCVFSLLGASPQPAKSFIPMAYRHYLGTAVQVGDIVPRGVVRYQPKSSTAHKVAHKIQEALMTCSLDRDTAGKLRGDLQWFFSMCSGYVGKMAGPLLTSKQRGDDPHLDIESQRTLKVLLGVVLQASPRDVHILCRPSPPVLVYSDASFESNTLRLGWIIFKGEEQPVGGSCLVPNAELATWKPRRQQIFPGESLCALLIPMLHRALLENQDILWFVDNCAAVAALIKCSSAEPDVHAIVQYSHLLLQQSSTRVWYEWIDSKSNVSDGLSRLGVCDPWTAKQNWLVFDYPFPDSLRVSSFLDALEASLESEQWVI